MEEITCEYGEYPYCPLCKYGCEIQEEWMPEDMCEWHCYHPNNPKPGNINQ